MRQIIALPSLALLLSCASAPPPRPAPLVEPAVDIDALVQRDGLIAFDAAEVEQNMGSGRKELRGTSYAELDGSAPQELIIHTTEYTGEGTWLETLWVYDVADASNPKPIPAPPLNMASAAPLHGGLSWGSYMDPGWWRVDDLDRDGRAEIIIVGHTDGTTASLLDVLGWDRRAGHLADELWRDPRALDVAFVDADGDARREIIALIAPQGDGGEPHRFVALRPDAAGRWREAPLEPGPWMSDMLDAILDEHPRAHQALPIALELMRQHTIAPRDLAALQARLEQKVAAEPDAPGELQYELAALYEAMAWPDNARAYEPMLKRLRAAESAHPVLGALLALDKQTGQTRGRDALMAWLKGSLDVEERLDDVATLLMWMEVYGHDHAAALVAQHIGSPHVTPEQRTALIERATRHLSSQRAALWPLLAPDAEEWLREELGAALLGELPPFMPSSEAWRAALRSEAIRPLMAHPATWLLGAQLGLYQGDAGLREEVWAWLDKAADPEQRLIMWRTAQQAAAPQPDLKRLLGWWARAQGEERSAIWIWALGGEGERLVALLKQSREPEELKMARDALYDPDLACDGPYSGPEGCMGQRGKLLDALAALHELVAQRLRSGDAAMKEAALDVMSQMPYEPTQRLLLDVARDPNEPLRDRAGEALISAAHPVAQDYMLARLEAHDPDESLTFALGQTLDALGAQQLVRWALTLPAHTAATLREQSLQRSAIALALAAPRACTADAAQLVPLLTAPSECFILTDLLTAIALCEPAQLDAIVEDMLKRSCDLDPVPALFEDLGARGVAAHLPALDALADDPRSRAIREGAHRAAAQIRARER